MSTRLRLFLALAALALLVLPTVALAAPSAEGAPPDPETCRRLWGTDEWTRRCAQADDDHLRARLIAYCRSVYGTDDWTARCRQLFNDFDPIAYCRRIQGTDLWTRRCLQLNPTPAPTPIVVRPAAVEPSDPIDVAPADPIPSPTHPITLSPRHLPPARP